MDLWIVAAITGAGYAAKYLQNFSREKETGLSAYRSSSEHQQSSYGANVGLLDIPEAESASISGFQGEFSDSNGRSSGYRRGRNSIRSRHNHVQYLKPLSSLESCLMAQICKGDRKMEDCDFAAIPSPCVPAFRPFVVTDGTRVISRPSFDSCGVLVGDDTKEVVNSDAFSEMNERVLGGIGQLPERGSRKGFKESSIREMPNEMQMSLQGPQSGAALFCLGVSIGITYSTLANKTEVTKLKDALKQTENLVQDLQEELEMNDSVTVKELISVSEDNVFPYGEDNAIDDKKLMTAHFQTNSEAGTCKAVEKVESMNQIEAELEAELERLELNMKSSIRAKPLDDNDNELGELLRGESRTDIRSSSSPSPSSVKQGVSPRDLSLRLHQVIQSQLEQRITELETALETSQKRVKHLESELGFFPHNDDDASSFSSSVSRGSPVATEPERELPLVMNLSGEALDAYNEAFEELSRVEGLKPDKQSSAACRDSREDQVSRRSLFEQDDDEDDDTTLLIKQIVAKTRRGGSSAILHAHRAMVSLDGSEK